MAKAWLYIQGQRVNPGSCSPTQGGSSPLSCSSRPENAGPPGLNINHSGGPGLSSEPGGLFFFFWEISKILQKRGCGPSLGPSCLSLPINQFKKQPLFPRAGGVWGCEPRGGMGHAEAGGWLDAPPGVENPLPSPGPCSSLLPGVTARSAPDWVRWVGARAGS